MTPAAVIVTAHAAQRWRERVAPTGGKADVRAALLRSRPAKPARQRRTYGGALARADPETGAVLVVEHRLGRWVVVTVTA